jgi:MoxR-like ATPase
MEQKLYEGTELNEKKEIKIDDTQFTIPPYLPGKELVKAVKLAQLLRRPLLVKGEPGCGKSRLAEAIAYELFKNEYRKYYFEWNVKSSSKAQDGLYVIDHLKRLSEANVKGEKEKIVDIILKKINTDNYQSKGEYIELGPLGKAFQVSRSVQKNGFNSPPVLLIDEIDKADIDFPNDLLLELDRMEFLIPEAKDQYGDNVIIKADKDFRPLIIITSNDEKPLPAAFLRRCLFHYIDFKDIKLKEIVSSNFSGLPLDVVDDCVKYFEAWRNKINEKQISIKNISTSELLDWVRLIEYYYNKEDNVSNLKVDGNKLNLKEDELPPYYQALLKDTASIKLFAKDTIA